MVVVGKWARNEVEWRCKARVAMWIGGVVVLFVWSCEGSWWHKVACLLLLIGERSGEADVGHRLDLV